MSFSPNNWLSGDIITAAKANNTDTQFAQSVKYSETNRQTVIEGATSSTDGTANFITGSTTALTAFATGSTGEPLLMSFSNGNSTLGGLNYDISLTTDSSWTSLTASNINYLYFDASTAGVITSSYTIVPPQYGYFFDTTQNSLIHFDGTAGSTTTTDNFGNTWTNFGTAVLSTAQIKFGTTSLTIPGSSNSYVQTTNITSVGNSDWTLEGWFYLASTAGTNKTFIASKNLNIELSLTYIAATGKLLILLSNSSSVTDIASSTGTTTITSSSWHSWALTYNSSAYRLFVDGSLDTTIASTLLVNGNLGGLNIGSDATLSLPWNGYIDEFRFTRACRYTASYTPSSSAFTGDVNFYDITKSKMYFGDPTSWTEKIRLFVGEAITSATAVTSAITYALKNKYDSLWFSVTNNTTYSKTTNLGIPSHLQKLKLLFRKNPTFFPSIISVSESNGTNGFGATPGPTTHKEVRIWTALNFINSDGATNVGATDVNTTTGEYRLFVERDF